MRQYVYFYNPKKTIYLYLVVKLNFLFQKIKQSKDRQRDLENEQVKTIDKLNSARTSRIEEVPTLQVKQEFNLKFQDKQQLTFSLSLYTVDLERTWEENWVRTSTVWRTHVGTNSHKKGKLGSSFICCYHWLYRK